MEGICIDWHPVAVAAAMMLIDIATGFAGAAKRGVIDSGALREGLWHKAGFCGLLVLVGIMCAYIVLTEVVSVMENLCVLNPDIADLPFVGRLGVHNPAAPDVTVGMDDMGECAEGSK